MFTGIVTDLGRVRAAERGEGGMRVTIDTAYDTAAIAVGASIACSGACLTVTDKGEGWFAADVSGETLSRTTLGGWEGGTPVNLERSLRLGEEFGGHLVTGHVDGVALVRERHPDGDSIRYLAEAPAALARYVAPKGSVTLDGVSLTVNEVEGSRFTVNIIPHTAACTTLGRLRPGDAVNLEVDLIARYVARLLPQS